MGSTIRVDNFEWILWQIELLHITKLTIGLKFEEIIRDLKNKVYHPVYFLQGEEPYFIDAITEHIAEHVLDESEREFNQSVVYGRDTNVDDIVSMAKRFPMMANHQVVIVKEAQHIRNIEQLEPYLDNPQPTTILVICYKYKKVDGRKAFGKNLKSKAVVLTSDKIRDYKVADWIVGYLKGKKHTISPLSCKLLADYLGTDIGKIVNELDKLMIVLPEGSEITPDDIERNIGISKDYNVFELQNALGKKNIVHANRIINYFAANPKDHPMVVTIAILYNYFSKLMHYHFITDKSERNVAAELRVNPFFVKDYALASKHYSAGKVARIISHLREYDLKSKGVNNASAGDGELMRELIYKITH